MNRFDTVFEQLDRPVLVDSDTTRVRVMGMNDGATGDIQELREFAASLVEEPTPQSETAGHADTADVHLRSCSW